MCYICQYCGKEFKNSGAHKMHENTCLSNPNRKHNLTKRKKYTKHIIDESEITCKYCGRQFKSKSNKIQHEAICKLNPNRIARTVRQKYDMMSDEELKNELKKYNSRKETPHQLISVCKERCIETNFKDNIFVKEHKLTDEELLTEVNKYEMKSQIPYGLKVELERRNISLPEKFNINPRKKINELTFVLTKTLINKIKHFNDIYEAYDNNCGNIIEELKRRNELPEKFNQKRTYSKFHYWTEQQIFETINKYSSKNELYKAGYGRLIDETLSRNIQNLPEWIYKNKFSKYHNLTIDELFDLLKSYKSRKQIVKENPELLKVLSELYKRLGKTDERLKRFSKNYHPEYETMTDEEIIKISKSEFLGQNIRSSLKINRPLINQLRKRNIIYIVFPDSDKSYYNADYWVKLATEKWGDTYDYSYVHSTYKNWKGKVKIGCKEHGYFEQAIGSHLSCGCPKCARGINFYKQEKLLLLTKYDLEGMDWAVIMDLIGEDKLPKEFYCLCKFGPNTEGRKQQIEKLKEFYSVEFDELEDSANEIIEQTVSNIDDETYSDDSDENELKTYEEIDTLADIFKVEEKEIYSTGDKYIHIFEKEMSKLWGLVLRDNECHSTKNVEFISKKLNDKNITPFAKHIYEEFMKEYEKVISFEAA